MLGGIRYEHTTNDYTGKRLVYDEQVDYVTTLPTEAGSSYGDLFPNLHLRQQLDGAPAQPKRVGRLR